MKQRCPEFFRLAPNRVWRSYTGGKMLDLISGAANPADSHFPEDWLLSTTTAKNVGREEVPDEGISRVVRDGEIVPLTQIIEAWSEPVFGAGHLAKFGKNAGFLLKYLDSSLRLHIQCHPSIAFAEEHLNSHFGKTEGYYILGVRPDCAGYVYLGFQNAPDPADFKTAIERQDHEFLSRCFEKIPVKSGDCFYVPGGIPHAIGEGVFMIEMMEPTDFAVRIEFTRGDYTLPESARFMNRGIDFALSMFDYTSRTVEETQKAFFVNPLDMPVMGEGKRQSLFDARMTGCFRAERYSVNGTVTISKESMAVLIVLAGGGTLKAGGLTCPLTAYDRILLPHATSEFELSGEMEVFMAMPPKAPEI